MKRYLALFCVLSMLAAPLAASADSPNAPSLTSLYAELVQVLKQELSLTKPSLSIDPSSGPAPFTTIFTLSNKTHTEAIDFGDGHSTGSNGCARNSLGFCDLRDQLVHTYLFPGDYTVTLYRYLGKDPIVVSTSTLHVSPALTSRAASTSAQ